MMLCRLIHRYQQSRVQDGGSKFLKNVGNHLYGVIIQKTTIEIFTTVQTSVPRNSRYTKTGCALHQITLCGDSGIGF